MKDTRRILGFYQVLIPLFILVLLFNPGTNGNNLASFGAVKLFGFIIVEFLVVFVLVLPWYWKKWSYVIDKLYVFISALLGFNAIYYLAISFKKLLFSV